MNPALRFAVGTAIGLALASCSGGGYGGGGPPTGACSAAPGGTAVAVSGLVRYQRPGHTAANALDYANIATLPVRGATVQVRRGAAANTSAAGALLGSSMTDGNGNYSINVTPYEQVKVCVRAESIQVGAQNWNVQVVDNTASSAVYVMETAAFCTAVAATPNKDLTAATGWGGAGYTGVRASAPFAILDSVYTAIQRIVAVQPTFTMDPLDLNWSVSNTNASGSLALGQIGTSFYSNDEIYILGDDNNDTDEFDGHVIIHEFGHYIEDNLSRSDSIGGSHSGGDLLDPRVAYGEGFGNAFAGIVTDDPVYQDSFGPQQGQGFDIDVESDTVSVSGDQEGWYSETTVQGLLYDFYDSNADTQTPTGGTTFTDNVALGLQPLWDVWVGAQRTSPAMTTIFPFLTQLRSDNAGAVAAINVMTSAREVIGTDAFGAGETNSGSLGNSSAAGCTTANEALPVHIPYTVGVTGTIGVPSANDEGVYNALGNRRFIVFTVGAGSRSFAVSSATSDADAYLYNAGTLVSFHEAVGNENWSENLPAGTYVLEVYSFENVDGPGAGDDCLQITIT
jgi:hypothetical protein